MSLKSIFTEQIQSLQAFMEAADQRLRVVAYMSDVEPLLEKVLAKWDDDAQNTHVLVVCSTSCASYPEYAAELLEELAEQNEKHRESLAQVGVKLPRVTDFPASLPPAERLGQYISQVATCLPCQIGKYAVILYPDKITDDTAYQRTLAALVATLRTPWARLVALDRKEEPRLASLVEQRNDCSLQVFDFSPTEIEQRVAEDLQGDGLSPAERRQYTAMQGAYAMGQGDYAAAEHHQRDALEMAREQKAASEEAALLYNLGNTYLAQDKLQLAEEHYASAIERGVSEELHGLVAMALTNLGVTLQRLGQHDQALESLAAAERTFHAIGHPPGRAYALDNKAQVLAKCDQAEQAEQAWLEALAVYEGITAETFRQVRDKGQEDIVDKLTKFYESTGQGDKLEQLRARGGNVA